MSNIVHKVKDALSSHKDHSTSTTGDETETDHSRNETHQQFDNNDTGMLPREPDLTVTICANLFPQISEFLLAAD